MPVASTRWRIALAAAFLTVVCFRAGGQGAETKSPERRFPEHFLKGEKADAARNVLSDYSLFRQRESVFHSTPKIYKYLFERLPLASDMIRALKFGKYKIAKATDGSFSIDTGAGVTGKFWIVHGEAQRKILYGEGEYNGWIIRRLGGRSIVMMTHRPGRDGDAVVMKNQMIVFVKVDNVVVEFFVKALDWLIRVLVRRQVRQASSAAQNLTEAIAREPAKVYEIFRKSPEIPKAALEGFRENFLSGKSPVSSQPPGSTSQPERTTLGARPPASAGESPARR